MVGRIGFRVSLRVSKVGVRVTVIRWSLRHRGGVLILCPKISNRRLHYRFIW